MKWTDYPQNIKVRLITSFFNRAVTSAVMPFMALFFAQEMSKVWAGSFLIITVFIGFFVNLIGGYISDRFSRKKVLVLTSSLSAVMFLLMALSLLPSDKWIGLFALAYVIFIITSSLGRPAMHAIIIDSTTPENRKAIYAIDYWMVNLSMAIGAALGGLLYLNHQIELFVLLTVTSASLPIAYQIWLTDERVQSLKKQHNNVLIDLLQNYKVAFQDRPFVKVVIGSMFIFSAEFSLNSYIGVRLAESFETFAIADFNVAGVHMLSLLNIQNMLLVVCLTFMINKFTDRFSKQHVLLTGLLLYSVGYITITSANSWYLLILFNLIGTIGELIYSPVRNAEMANMIPEDKRGSYSAFSNFSFSGADLLARSTIILGAFLIPTMMSVYMGVLLMIGTLLVYTGLFVSKAKNDQLTKREIVQKIG
ncbi:permease [Planococcus antarcticus DSM 14505]|uniref:MFS transporter n=1 Tax=Planococcus antarcticus DSM 14505 TaxID=1185653 RepID=A0A1C7DHR7_9BACL|nr:MFS transporter [Planococcus antarcticus]ANU10962.1 MFS transporter [Planococcus antarcticus DSM 14505]EIM07118.1 permease [Planococcus antarcticus DSM 14505]